MLSEKINSPTYQSENTTIGKENDNIVDDIAIRVLNLSKCYQIYDLPRDRLKQFVLPRLQRLIRKEPTCYFHEFWALKDISFEIKKGETVGIIGRNGSGKSTLLQIICGTISPSNGAVETNGRIAALLELGSGFNFEFTGHENIYMNSAILGLSQKEIDTSYDDIISFADIGDFIEQPVKTYSSGMMLRLAFAVAINCKPQILIVDEALSVGDESFQRKCFSKIKALKKNGTTILFVSHSAGTVAALCDNVILLDSGSLICRSTPKNAINIYQSKLYSTASINNKDNPREINSADDIIEKQEESCENEQTGYYNAEIQSKSMISYPFKRASINEISLTDTYSKKRNVLRSGQIYHLSFHVNVYEDIDNAVLGFHIKNIRGIEIGGISYPSNSEGIKLYSVKSPYIIMFPFIVRMRKGDYFITTGIRSQLEEGFCHRISDVVRFSVLADENQNFFGLCDFQAPDRKVQFNSK